MSTPRSIIKFYDVFDLLPNYVHTRYFATASARDTYFDSVASLTIQNVQHVRVDELQVKIPKNVSDIHSYTYMSIQNTHGASNYDHRYYCFIMDCEYVSDMCTLVTYKIDVMMTFCMNGLFSSSMPYKSLVIRCHNDTDNIGDNLVTEPFNVSDYVESTAVISKAELLTYKIVVGVCSAQQQLTLDGHTINLMPHNYTGRLFTGTTYLVFDVSNASGNQALIDLFNYFQGRPNELVSIYTVPSMLIGTVIDNYVLSPTSPIASTFCTYTNGRKISDGFEGYSPDNKKLFTAPFTMFRVTNYEGEKLDLEFEKFANPDLCEFEMDGTLFGEPSVSVYPRNYGLNTSSQSNPANYDYALSCDNYACGAWASSAFASYIQKNGAINAMKMLMSTIGTMAISSMMTGGVGAVASTGTALVTAQSASNMQVMDRAMGLGEFGKATLAQMSTPEKIDIARGGLAGSYQAWKILCESIRAKNTGGSASGTGCKGTTAQINAHKGIYFKTIKIRKYLAQQIDNFFTMYGYAQNKLINVGDYLQNHHRPIYAYIQTDNFAVLNGAIEQKYKIEISKIMDKGITFWFTTSVAMGNYNVGNTPT